VKILLAVDNTQPAVEAARTVRDCFPQAEVEILHVLDIEAVPHSHLSAALIDKYHEKIRRRLQAEADRFLPKVLEIVLRLSGGVRVLIRDGPTAEMILRTASSFYPDMIVLGSRGLREMQAWLLGSVSYRVAQEARCPVLLIKHLLPAIPKLLLVVDQSGSARRAVQFLFEQPGFPRYHVVVLCIQGSSPTQEGFLQQIQERLTRRALSVDARVLTGDPETVILECARREGIDLVVMAVTDPSQWWKRWLRDRLSHRIMRNATMSVLIIHAKDQDGQEEGAA
jgi:nucleotide-binding universal stress UspA family protein